MASSEKPQTTNTKTPPQAQTTTKTTAPPLEQIDNKAPVYTDYASI